MQESSISVMGRVTYEDVFHIPHCIDFIANYVAFPLYRFISNGGFSLCDRKVKSVRYNRVCVPTADKKGARLLRRGRDSRSQIHRANLPPAILSPALPQQRQLSKRPSNNKKPPARPSQSSQVQA